MSLPQRILNVLDTATSQFAPQIWAATSSFVEFPVLYGGGILVSWLGYQILMGEASTATAMKRFGLVAVVAMVVLNPMWFGFFYDLCMHGHEPLLSKMGLGGSEAEAIDKIFDRGSSAAFAIFDKASWDDIALMFFAALVYIMTLFLTASAIFILVVARLIATITIGLGPLFIFCFMFQNFRQYAMNWIGLLLGMVVLRLMTFSALSFAMFLVNRVAISPGVDINGPEVPDIGAVQAELAPLIVIELIFVFLFLKLDQWATTLTGGAFAAAGSGIAAAGAMMSAPKSAMSAARNGSDRRRQNRRDQNAEKRDAAYQKQSADRAAKEAERESKQQKNEQRRRIFSPGNEALRAAANSKTSDASSESPEISRSREESGTSKIRVIRHENSSDQ